MTANSLCALTPGWVFGLHCFRKLHENKGIWGHV